MKRNRWLLIIAAGVVLPMISYYACNSNAWKKLHENRDYTIARVDYYSPDASRYSNGGSFNYHYTVYGVEYSGYRKYYEFSSRQRLFFEGKYFPVVFDSKSPSFSAILMLPEDFAEFGLAYPDSLQWVVKLAND